jgi:glycerate-2-kinase
MMPAGTNGRELLPQVFKAAVQAVDPYTIVAGHIPQLRSLFMEGGFSRLHVVAFGKGACGMTKAVTEGLGDILSSGIAVTRYGHWGPLPPFAPIRAFEAGHPVPDESGLRATREITRFVRSLDERSFLVCLVSGGGSALLVAPLPPLTLEEKQRTTELLLRAGADISELNIVRKHISAVKGGKLATMSFPARTVSLILSDVVGDRVDTIASGPTVPDPSTYSEAMEVLDRYGLRTLVPKRVEELLVSGAEGRIPETPKESDPAFDRVENAIVGSNDRAIDAALAQCSGLGLEGLVIGRGLKGEARLAARWLAKTAREVRRDRGRDGKPLCLISGGETTVTVRGRGVGGRNMELALAFALEIEGEEGIALLSAGTDGIDGPTEAAGAIVDGSTVGKAREAGIDAAAHLEDNDSCTFFQQEGGLFTTGPTGTNVMDLQLMLLDPSRF